MENGNEHAPYDLNLPGRSPLALSGSQFVALIEDLGPTQEREQAIYEQVITGNVPDFLRRSVPVKAGAGDLSVLIYAFPDYLCVGSDEDFVRVPLDPMTAQAIADVTGTSLPTRKMVNDIWNAAEVKLPPQPMGPPQYPYDSSMMTTSRFNVHNQWIEKTRAGKPLGALTGGHKKDVVITKLLEGRSDKVAIYGWHQSNGKPIQGPGIQAEAHEITYKDYSHGIRLVSLFVRLGEEVRVLSDVFLDEALHKTVSDEGPLKDPRYPVAIAAA
jgi:hypothetical protein